MEVIHRALISSGFVSALVLAGIWSVSSVQAEHNTFLPLIPNTPLMQQLVKAQEYTWCADSRAASYPSFLSQLRDVNAEYEKRVGIRSREVAFPKKPNGADDYGSSSTGCQVQHVMGLDFPCGSGAAACIYYANFPVEVHYQESLGYVDWRTAHGHELGHGLLGLHEQYDDKAGGIGCTRKQWTVMDCASGVRYPQDWDVARGCEVIRTAWCGNPPPPPEFCCQADYNGDGNFDDGYYHIPTGRWLWDVLCRWEWSEAQPWWKPEKGCP